METGIRAHVQHRGVFGEHLAVHALQADHARVLDHALHHEPPEAVALERRAHDHGVFAPLAVGVEVQAHDAEHLAVSSPIAMNAIARS